MANRFGKIPVIKQKVVKIGIFGGTFDPFHRGHYGIVAEACHYHDYDRIFYVPTFSPPHKKPVCSFVHRLKMTQLGMLKFDEAITSPIEQWLSSPSYTINLVMSILWTATENLSIDLIMGIDEFEAFTSWEDWKKLTELCTLTVISRGGNNLNIDEFKTKINLLYGFGAKVDDEENHYRYLDNVIFVKNPETDIMDVSSTFVRKIIKEDYAKISRYVPLKVAEYIKKNNLYFI